jgi:transaldolase
MIGRLDDFLREVAHDNQAAVSESDIRQAGLAVTKRAYALYRERGYEAVLLVAALRGDYHLTEIAGAELIMSIAPAFQEVFVNGDLPREERIDRPVAPDVIERLPDAGIRPRLRARRHDARGIRLFGATQRTLCQFCEVGWKLMESYR